MTEKVEGDVAQRDVLLQLGSARDPLAQLLRKDQRIVAEAQCVFGDVGGCGDGADAGELLGELERVDGYVAVHVDVVVRGAHRCGTPSDAV